MGDFLRTCDEKAVFRTSAGVQHVFRTDSAATINARIQEAAEGATATDKGKVYFEVGVYTLDAQLVGADHVECIPFEGRVTLRPGYNGVGADDPLNSMVSADGALDLATLNTTFSATKPRVSATWATTSVPATGSLDGKWVLGSGHPDGAGGQNSLGDSDGTTVSLGEIKRVRSNVTSMLTLDDPADQTHAALNSLQAVLPRIGFRMERFTFDAFSNGTFATAVSGKYSVGLELIDCHFRGFSRYAVALLRGARDADLDLYDLGDNNGVLDLESANRNHFNVRSKIIPGAAYACATGTQRAKVWLRDRSSLNISEVCDLAHGAMGVEENGGKDNCFGLIRGRDLNPDAMYTARVALGEFINGQKIGLVYSGGSAPLDPSEATGGSTIDLLTGSELVTSRADTTIRCAYLHDGYSRNIDRMIFQNRGVKGNVCGPMFSDTDGEVGKLIVSGYDYGIATENGANTVFIADYQYSGACGSGANCDVAIYLNHTERGFRIGRARISDCAYPVQLAASFADWDFSIERLKTTSWLEEVVVAFNNSGAQRSAGDLVEVDPGFYDNAIPRVYRAPTAVGASPAAQRMMIVASLTPDGNRGLVCPAPVSGRAVVYCTTAVVNAGDILKWSAVNGAVTAVADNTPAAYNLAIGKALTYKAVGAIGLVEVGPV